MKDEKKELAFEAGEDCGLLACVRKELSAVPGGKVKSYLEHGCISVDGTVSRRFDCPVKKGQTVRVLLSKNSSYGCPLESIYEDAYLFAVNKPAGLLSVASDTEKENTAIRLLRESGMPSLFVVHRLDRDTSGVLLFAKSEEIRDRLQETWDESIRREYLAVCEGIFAEKSGRRETYLRETQTHLVYSAKSGDGKRAVTNYEVVKDNGKYSYVRIRIETGRKNQIRVHMKELGHPVVGDKKYGAHGNPLGRLGLHASALEFVHPATGKTVTLRARPDARFRLPK